MYIADLHIHSKYSRATSKDCDLPHLDLWARRKGLSLVGTGDFTHPGWREELANSLEPAEDGLYRLKEELRIPDEVAGDNPAPRFVITGEISSIYKKNGRVRKVHNVILLPDLEAAGQLSHRLEAVGNLHSDGRPILGLDCHDLLELTLDSCPMMVFIPAHIWTPHFSLLGAFSGFESIEECFEDLTGYIHALETGLSSDPPMNWRVSSLDNYTLVSNSDAHSPSKLAREANLLDTGLSYPELAKAIETGVGFAGTLEFFPEEGKYHMDGHRNCHLCLEPAQTLEYQGRCPVCGKKITIGVQHRVEELADRPDGAVKFNARPFQRLVPLPELLAASMDCSVSSKKVEAAYLALLKTVGPELYILREAPYEELKQKAGLCVAEGIQRLREGKVALNPGYDGEYGTISLFTSEELKAFNGQISLFGAPTPPKPHRKTPAPSVPSLSADKKPQKQAPVQETLNEKQAQAVTALERVVSVVAGPGTGKTKTLVARVAWLLEQGAKPSEITAVTFTNLAAEEMRQRLEKQLGGKSAIRGMTIGTFHAICAGLLDKTPLLDEQEALELAASLSREFHSRLSPRNLLYQISKLKNGVLLETPELSQIAQAYQQRLGELGVRDLDDLLLEAVQQSSRPKKAFTHLLVDEFQDINHLQYQLIQKWSQHSQSLFVIGDPDQAIYGFRGASNHYFQQLEQESADFRKVTLDENYRSTPQILSAALSVIAHNPGGSRTLHPNQNSGCPVRAVAFHSPTAEGIFIAKEINRMVGGVGMLEAHAQTHQEEIRSFADIAILCRTHRQLESIERCLRHDGIPYMVSGRESYLEDPQVRGALAFFRFLLNPQDQLSLSRCLELVWGCSPDLISQVQRICAQMTALEPAALQQEVGNENPSLQRWLEEVQLFLPRVTKELPASLLERWTASHDVSEPFSRLISLSSFYRRMDEFLQALLLGGEGDLRRISASHPSGAVHLMTLHGAKGLEFPVVFLAGLNKGAFPPRSVCDPSDLEEERRLLFVGMTRAKQALILTIPGEDSPFLEQIPQELLLRSREGGHSNQETQQLSLF